jgi:hypothetical protein
MTTMETDIQRWEGELNCFWPEWKPNRIMKVICVIVNRLSQKGDMAKTIAKRIESSDIPWLIVQFVLFGGWYSCQEPQSAVYILMVLIKVFVTSGVSKNTVYFMIDMMKLDEIVQRLKDHTYEEPTDCYKDDKIWLKPDSTFIATSTIPNIEYILTKILELRRRAEESKSQV